MLPWPALTRHQCEGHRLASPWMQSRYWASSICWVGFSLMLSSTLGSTLFSLVSICTCLCVSYHWVACLPLTQGYQALSFWHRSDSEISRWLASASASSHTVASIDNTVILRQTTFSFANAIRYCCLQGQYWCRLWRCVCRTSPFCWNITWLKWFMAFAHRVHSCTCWFCRRHWTCVGWSYA